jgi:hypothetical protein
MRDGRAAIHCHAAHGVERRELGWRLLAAVTLMMRPVRRVRMTLMA